MSDEKSTYYEVTGTFKFMVQGTSADTAINTAMEAPLANKLITLIEADRDTFTATPIDLDDAKSRLAFFANLDSVLNDPAKLHKHPGQPDHH